MILELIAEVLPIVESALCLAEPPLYLISSFFSTDAFLLEISL